MFFFLSRNNVSHFSRIAFESRSTGPPSPFDNVCFLWLPLSDREWGGHKKLIGALHAPRVRVNIQLLLFCESKTTRQDSLAYDCRRRRSRSSAVRFGFRQKHTRHAIYIFRRSYVCRRVAATAAGHGYLGF